MLPSLSVFLCSSLYLIRFFVFFFFNDTATTEIYTLSLHDALPIWCADGPERAPARLSGFSVWRGLRLPRDGLQPLLHRRSLGTLGLGHHINQGGPVAGQRGSQRRFQFGRLAHPHAVQAETLRDAGVIGVGREVHGQIALVLIQVLERFDPAERGVVEEQQGDGKVQAGDRFQFAAAHPETAVADEADDGRVGTREFRADDAGNGISQTAVTARDDDVPPGRAGVERRGERRPRARVGDDDAVRREQLLQGAHDALRLERNRRRRQLWLFLCPPRRAQSGKVRPRLARAIAELGRTLLLDLRQQGRSE